jgi:hypothetical protein
LSETDNPEPEEWPILHAFVQLAKISLDIKQLHQNRHPSLEIVSAACDHLVRRLQRVSDDVKKRLKIDLDREMQVKDRQIPCLLLKLGNSFRQLQVPEGWLNMNRIRSSNDADLSTVIDTTCGIDTLPSTRENQGRRRTTGACTWSIPRKFSCISGMPAHFNCPPNFTT